MPTVSRENLKKRGFKRFIKSFSYSFDGLKYAFKYEQNILVHSLAVILVLFCGIYFRITKIEWLICLMLIGLVISTELINTSIEATIDLCSPEYNKLAKIAKDTASAAVLVFALVAFISGLIIFVPYFLNLI